VPRRYMSRRDPRLLRDMYLRGTCYTVAASLPFTVGAIVFANVVALVPARLAARTPAALVLRNE